MTWAAVVLIGLGVADLVRSTATRRGRAGAHVAGPVTIVVVATVTGLFGWVDLLALALAAGGGAVWIELSEQAQSNGRHPVRALACLGVIIAGLLAFGGAASSPGGALQHWLLWADLPGPHPAPTSRVLLVTALVLANLATANIVVRLVLLATGALRPGQLTAGAAPQAADRLKGGRLLGPMERLVILGLGLVGEFAAAGLVIAAKGLLRFPEIQASARGGATAAAQAVSPSSTATEHRPAGIDEVTEYFLVGSFVSWLVALLSLAVTR